MGMCKGKYRVEYTTHGAVFFWFFFGREGSVEG